MPKAMRTEIFNVTPEKIFNVIIDYASYPNFVDGVSEINVKRFDSNGALVEYSINLIKKFSYLIELKHTPYKSVSWSLVSGDIFKKNNGSWILNDLGNNKTEVKYEVDVEFKGFAPDMVVKKLVSSNLPSMMEAYHKRAQSI